MFIFLLQRIDLQKLASLTYRRGVIVVSNNNADDDISFSGDGVQV